MFYEEKINEKLTIQKTKQYLIFLGKHMQSFSYQEYIENLQPMIIQEEDIMDYMQYSRSIMNIQTAKISPFNHVIQAMQKKENEKQRKQEREQQLQWICYGIQRLKEKERAYILERYIYHLDNKRIMEKYGVVESTINRNIRKGCLNLAFILKIEEVEES